MSSRRSRSQLVAPAQLIGLQLVSCTLLLALVLAHDHHRTRVQGRKLELPPRAPLEPQQVERWTINTVERPSERKIWRVFKEKYLRDDWRNQHMQTDEMEQLVRTVWARRVEMLKSRYECAEHAHEPDLVDQRTVDPIVEPSTDWTRPSCDLDPLMCANRPRSAHRREYDKFLQSYNRTRDTVGFGQHGFNPYTLRKTIYTLRVERNHYMLCNGQPSVSIDETMDEPLAEQ